MNYITNQSGEKVVAIGQEGSAMRHKYEYDITMPKLIAELSSKEHLLTRDNIYKADLKSFEAMHHICTEDKVPAHLHLSLIRSAFLFYFKETAND